MVAVNSKRSVANQVATRCRLSGPETRLEHFVRVNREHVFRVATCSPLPVMASSSSLGTPVLHIYPAQWDLPSLDPACLTAVLYLQLAIPHRFSVVECSNPDESPSGG